MGSSDQFNIRWNNYTTVLQNVFRKLLEGEQFVDVTLACEGQSIKCHRLILSACSTYFDRILTDNPSSNLVIYLKDMKFWELRALVTFMYNGEVSISQQKLPHLCKAAEALKVKGLAHDTGLTDGDMDRLDEDELEDYRTIDGKESSLQLQNSHRGGGPIQHGQQQKSLLRQHNNLSAYAAAQANRQPQQIKRKILTQPPKLVKMQRVEQRSSNGGGVAAGSSVGGGNGTPKIQQLPVNKMVVKKAEAVEMSSASVSQVKENYEEEEGYSMQHDMTADSSIKDEADVGDGEDNEEMDGGDENESLGSLEGDDTQLGQAAKPNKIAMKYGKEVRDSALSALQSGMTLRQCSETYGIPKKTLSKWKSREAKQEGEEDATSPNRTKEASGTMSGTIVLPPKQQQMGAPVDAADRAERLRKATELAMSGVTVRQAAAHFEIPRTTLCAYMKRRGLAAKRNFLPNNSTGSPNNLKQRTQGGKSSEASNAAETNGQGSSVILTRCTTYHHNESTKSSESGAYSEEGGTESGNEQDVQGTSRSESSNDLKMLSLPPGIRPKKIRVIRKHKVEVLTDAAVCILEGMTFQQVSEKFDVPKTTLRDFMVRRGLLQRGAGKKQGFPEGTTAAATEESPSTSNSTTCTISKMTD